MTDGWRRAAPIAAALALALAACAAAGCSGDSGGAGAAGPATALVRPASPPAEAPALVVEKRLLLGTDVTVSARGRDRAALERAIERAFAEIEAVDRAMSNYKAESDLSRLNRAPPGTFVPVAASLAEVLEASRRFARLSDGAFDPGILPVVELWRTRASEGREPSPDEIAQARAAGGIEGVRCERDASGGGGGRAARPSSAARYDLGGIAKGYAVDRAVARLREAEGFEGALVNAGGDLFAAGAGPAGPGWRVGIEAPAPAPLPGGAPHSAPPAGVLRLRDRAACTSGPARRGFEVAGRRYSHIFDPRTGRPLPFGAALGVTAVAADATTADALATAISVLGPERGFALARRLGAEAVFFRAGPSGEIERLETPGVTALLEAEKR